MKKFLVALSFLAVTQAAADFVYDPHSLTIEDKGMETVEVKYNGVLVFLAEPGAVPHLENLKQQAKSQRSTIKARPLTREVVRASDVHKSFYLPRVPHDFVTVSPDDITLSTKGIMLLDHSVRLYNDPRSYEVDKSVYNHLSMLIARARGTGSLLDIDTCFLANPPLLFDVADIEASFLTHKDKPLDPESITCSVCHERAPTMACMPCGHLCFCEACSRAAANTPCPICREKVSKHHKIFY